MSDSETTTVSQRQLLELVSSVRDALLLPNGQIPWTQLWKIFNIFEVIAKNQEQIVQTAEEVSAWLHELEEERQIVVDETTKAQLREIVDGKDGERERYFALALFWKRHAIWHQVFVNPSDPEGGLQLVSRYLLASTRYPEQQDTCLPQATSASETTLLLDVADTCRDRLRRIDRWLKEHPEATSMLKDRKGKGKGKADQAEQTKSEIRHLVGCLTEIEPRGRLRELQKATGEWLNAYESRLAYLGRLKEECQAVPEVLEEEEARKIAQAERAGQEALKEDNIESSVKPRRSKSQSLPISSQPARMKAATSPVLDREHALPKAGPSTLPKSRISRTAKNTMGRRVQGSPQVPTDGSVAVNSIHTSQELPLPAVQDTMENGIHPVQSKQAEEQISRVARRRTMERGTSPIAELLVIAEAVETLSVKPAAMAGLVVTNAGDPQNQQQSQSTGTDSQNTVSSSVPSNFTNHSPPSPTSLPNVSPSPPPPPGQSRPHPPLNQSSRATTPPSVPRATVSETTTRQLILPSSNLTDHLAERLGKVEQQHQAFLSMGSRSSPPTLVSSDPHLTRLPAPAQTRNFLQTSTSSRAEEVPKADTPRPRKQALEVVKPIPVPSPEKRLVEEAAREAERKRKLASLNEEPAYNAFFAGIQEVPQTVGPPKQKRKVGRPSRAEMETRASRAGDVREQEAVQSRSVYVSSRGRRTSLAVSTFSEIEDDSEESSQGRGRRRETERYVQWMDAEEDQ